MSIQAHGLSPLGLPAPAQEHEAAQEPDLACSHCGHVFRPAANLKVGSVVHCIGGHIAEVVAS